MRAHAVLGVVAALVLVESRGDLVKVESICGNDALLRCLAPFEPGVQYKSVNWYKVSEGPKFTGILRKRLSPHNSTIEKFKGMVRHVEIHSGNSHDLILPNVTAEDSGMYACTLSAPLGQRNQDGEVFLTIVGCSEKYGRREELAFAIILLFVALLQFSISYVCLKSALRSKKNNVKNIIWKISQQKVLGSKGFGQDPFPHVYV
ncbi:CD83 antigen-like [Denticeps clupeoides]|uniref:Ig-like domain-containing protein n=1 Tax=Denticeps clupeoides TaxID=299321 RepID=A0AAY4B262_9TELE|nr:CD83 antigen [Denticeps clupeoides]